MEQRKLSEQKQLEAKELRRSQEAARQKEAEKSRIQYDLMDAIPACRQVVRVVARLCYTHMTLM
jgi:succinylglutamate desuccinylase